MYDPRRNETVTFGDRKGGPRTGEVIRINQKTVTVETEPGHEWRVPPALIAQPGQSWSEHLLELEARINVTPTWARGDEVAFGPDSRFAGIAATVESVGPKNTVVRIASYRGRPARVTTPHSHLTINS